MFLLTVCDRKLNIFEFEQLVKEIKEFTILQMQTITAKRTLYTEVTKNLV